MKMTKEYIIHGHGLVQHPLGRLLEPFHSGKSTITFFSNYGSCATINRNKLSITSGMKYSDPIHYMNKASNLSRRVIESRTGVPLFTQNGWVPDLWVDISPSNLRMAGIHEVNEKGLFRTLHVSRHKQPYMLLSTIVDQLGPAHFYVLSCRGAAFPVHHENTRILSYALGKNKNSTSRRTRKINNTNMPVSLRHLQTRKKQYSRKTN